MMQTAQHSALMQIGRIGKCSQKSVFIICSSLTPNRCLEYHPSYHYLHRQHRYNSGSSSGDKNNNNTDAIATTVTETIITKRRSNKRRKNKQSYSPLLQIISNHPKNTNPPYNNSTNDDNIKLLTRKQLLRLTPKQRSNLHRHRLQQHKDSMSYLQQARTNVRSNLNYLGDTAGSNFKKNIKTIQRLFRGEEEDVVWKKGEEVVIVEGKGGSKQQQRSLKHQKQQLKSQQQQEEEMGLDWERVPTEIQKNVKTNLVTLQNWLHKATDGMIPSPSLVNTDGTSTGGSIATRVQHFHQTKQSHGLVMDNNWLSWNIALALLPGALIGLYLYTMQDEMREYYMKLEEQERARILGPSAAMDGKKKGGGVSQQQQQEEERQNGNNTNEKKKGMGISSAFVLEGGGVLERVKLAMNDLFLGGVEERVGKAPRDVEEIEGDSTEKQQQQQQQDDGEQSTSSASTSTSAHDDNSTANQSPSESEVTLDPAMKVLLQRIEQLEKQLGVENKGSDVQEHQSNEHADKHTEDKISRQSPMQIRRDASLASKWSKEEQMKRATKEAVIVSTTNDDESDANDENSITLWKFLQGMKSLVDNDVDSVQEMIRQKISILEDLLASTSKEEEVEVNEANEETANKSNINDVAEITAQKDIVNNVPEKVDIPIEEKITSSTAAVEKLPDGVEDEQAKDAQVKGFRAWISRLLFRKQNRDQADTG